VTKKVCNRFPAKVPSYIEVPKCANVPRPECKDITRYVEEINCEPENHPHCIKVPKQASVNVPFEVCEDIPMEKCVDVPKQVPRKICKDYGH